MELTGQFRTGVSIFEKLDGIVQSVYSKKKKTSYVRENGTNHLNDKCISFVQKDKLIGIYNLRYINERLPVDITYNKVNNIPLSLILTDIDFLTKIKDKYGVTSSEKILVDYSKLILRSIRRNVDWVGSVGRGKLLIVLNGTDLKSAYCVAEKIRKQIENATFRYDDSCINITSSFGLYNVMDYSSEISVSELISKVNNNLHHAKLRGRNRTYPYVGFLDEVDFSESNKEMKLSELEKQICELRGTLNQICCSYENNETSSHRLIISQNLDELIVEYMKVADSIE